MQESRFVHRVAVNTPTLFPATSTNVYIVASQGEAVLIDTGYEDRSTEKQIIEAVRSLDSKPIHLKGIILTHYHRDHSHGAKGLSDYFQCPIMAHALEVDFIYREIAPYRVNHVLHEGDIIRVGDLHLHIMLTPGHTMGHISLWLKEENMLFGGDNVIKEGSVWIGPPDGDLALYLQSLQRLKSFCSDRLAPGHGEMIDDVAARIDSLITRRLQRESQIIHLLKRFPLTVAQLVDQIYRDQIHPSVHWAAERTVEGHLIKLLKENRVQTLRGTDSPRYAIVTS